MRLHDRGAGQTGVSAAVAQVLQDWAKHKTEWTIERYHEDIAKAGLSLEEFQRRFRPYSVSRFEGNVLLNEGINNVLTTVLGGGSPTVYDNTNARLGVGDSSTAEDASQTGLQAASNKAWVAMEGGYPTYGSSQQIVWRSSFNGSTANFAWNEWVVKQSTSSKCLNRKVESLGTKTSGTWTLEVDITLS